MATAGLEVTKTWKCFDGWVRVIRHSSTSTRTPMTFALYTPPAAETGPVPVLYFLSGLTCTWENFTTKAGALAWASAAGIAIVAPDTSPRGANIEGEAESWDFGVGAGFYLNATEPKWSTNYRMFDYVTSELPALLSEHYGTHVDVRRASITGHSMGGLGALVCALKNPGMYRSVSAFAPISHPSEAPWGKKAFTGYLGADTSTWKEWDPTELVSRYSGPALPVRMDTGAADEFYIKGQLLPEHFVAAASANGVAVDSRMHEGYDHSYYFVSTFMEQHVAFHAKHLKA